MSHIRIHNLVLGPVMTNVYLVQNTETKELLIIDPSDRPDRIKDEIRTMEGIPKAILLTHAHFDHAMAVEALRADYGIDVYVEEHDEAVLENPSLNLSTSFIGVSFAAKADHLLHDGQEITLAGIRLQVLHTPGHTIGSSCYYLPDEKVLFSGDTLFAMSYGRVDFPTSSSADMQNSIHRLLTELDDDVQVYPGHDQFTSIETEKRYNPLA